MKRITTTIIGLSLVAFSSAQINLGIRTGLTLATQDRVNHEDYYEQTTKGKAKIHFGAFADFRISDKLFAQPAIIVTGKGASHKSSYNGVVSELKMTYIDLPLNIVYKHPVAFGKLYGGLGPVIGFATSGKFLQNGKSKDMFGDGSDFNRLDAGFDIIGGVELANGLTGGVSYQANFVDIYSHKAAKIRNRTFNISIGYLLNWKK